MLIEIRKGIAIGLLVISFYGITAYIYDSKIKYREINGYKYKWSENKKSTFIKRKIS